MKIGVVSDTHSRPVPSSVLEGLAKMDLILHAGDFCSAADVKQFESLKELRAVHGNMDDADVRKKLPRKAIFEVGKFRIGLFHGEGPREQVPERVRAEFAKDRVDCVVFGHSHQAFNEKIGPTLFFNPGSPNDTVCAPFCSYGVLELGEAGITGKIIKVK